MKRYIFAALLFASPAYGADTILTPNVGIDQSSPQAPLHIGQGTTMYSANPSATINESVALTGSEHGWSDNNNITFSAANTASQGYGSFDCRLRATGTNGNHLICFQRGAVVNITGSIDVLQGDGGQMTLDTGHANKVYGGGEDVDVALHNGATSGKSYGRFCGSITSGTTENWCYWADTKVHVPYLDVKGAAGELARFATAASTSADRWITIGAQDLNTEGGRIGYNGSTGNMWMGCNYVTCKFEILSQRGVKITGLQAAPSGSQALCFKDGEMFVSSSNVCP